MLNFDVSTFSHDHLSSRPTRQALPTQVVLDVTVSATEALIPLSSFAKLPRPASR